MTDYWHTFVPASFAKLQPHSMSDEYLNPLREMLLLQDQIKIIAHLTDH